MGKLFLNVFWVIVLTMTTQIGGVLYLLAALIYRRNTLKRWGAFVVVYLVSTFFVVPYVAPFFGREKIQTTDTVKLHMLFTSLTNRDYVIPEVNTVLINVSTKLSKLYPEVEVHCLDANFPFFDGFPLLPHVSHNDGKKLDISLIYENKKGRIINDKPSVSGYGVFEPPLMGEYDQISVCKEIGYWQYDFPKYLTLGTVNSDLNFSEKGTKKLVQFFTQEPSVSKIFIEPHLRARLQIKNPRIRYHGCRAVRHDDHIHIQVL